MDQFAPIYFVNPPTHNEVEVELDEDEEFKPYRTRAFLNLGPDGYWELDTFAESAEHRSV